MTRIALTLKMKKLLTVAQKYIRIGFQMLVRFITNSPANEVETVLFNKFRSVLVNLAF